jgi:2-deoxy-D-gluconate 3-dehydrogenase
MASPDLAGRTALVTGAFSGFGLHFSRLLAAHGAKVAMVGRRVELGSTLAKEIAESAGRPGDVRAFAVDVTDPASVHDGLVRTCAELGTPAIVVNNAGAMARGPALELTDDAWQGVVDVNLSGVFRIAQASARAMIEGGVRGSIINIASILGLRGRSQVVSYATTKAGIVQLTKLLALEWAEHGIRVNALAPGYFDTDISRAFLATDAGRALVGRIPQQRVGRLGELDGPLLLLASDASSYMTGAVIPVDGGHVVSTL